MEGGNHMNERLINIFVRLVKLDIKNFVVDRRRKNDILKCIVCKGEENDKYIGTSCTIGKNE